MTQPKLNHRSGNTWQHKPRLEVPNGPGDVTGTFFLVLNHSRIVWESYFIKCDVLQSVLPWFICFGCGNIPLSSLCTYTLINLLPVENFHLPCNYLGMEKRILDMSPSRTIPYWLSEVKTETTEFWHCVIWSLSVSVSSLTYLCNGSDLSYLVLEAISLVIILSGFW